MNRMLCLILCLACGVASAQTAIIAQYEGKYHGIVILPNGSAIVLKEVIVKTVTPPNPTTGIASQLIVLRDQTQARYVPVLLDLQAKYTKGVKPEMYLLDNIDKSKVTQSWLAIKPAIAAFPYYFIVEKGGRILAQGELADTTEKNVAIVAKFQEKP